MGLHEGKSGGGGRGCLGEKHSAIHQPVQDCSAGRSWAFPLCKLKLSESCRRCWCHPRLSQVAQRGKPGAPVDYVPIAGCVCKATRVTVRSVAAVQCCLCLSQHRFSGFTTCDVAGASGEGHCRAAARSSARSTGSRMSGKPQNFRCQDGRVV